ncbi:MAG: hypothetical protein ACLP3R_01280 [Candidatus Korobacteraceae bacterium]|jgi:hypothetical protein
MSNDNGKPEPAIEWRQHPHIAPGVYPAYARHAKQYWDKCYHRWVCAVMFDVLSDDLCTVVARVPRFLNLGPGKHPRARARSDYLAEWVRANRGPPVRGDRLSPRVFTGRMARVEVGDTDASKSPVPYSVVRKILSWETGAGGVNLSSSHTVKGSNTQP